MTLTGRRFPWSAMTMTVAAMTAQTAAAEDSAPFLSVEITAEAQHDSTFNADDPTAEISDTFATIEAAVTAQITQAFSVQSTLMFEPVLDPTDDRVFEDHGLYAEELFGQIDHEGVALKLGKFNPAFAIGWDAAPGIYGADFAEDYELAEQIGLGLSIPFTTATGEHSFSAAVFFADTTFLSGSVFQDRQKLDVSDGGAGNTEKPNNFAVSLDGQFESFGYSIGARRLAAGKGDANDEIGVSLALARTFAVGESGELEMLGEVAWLDGVGGEPKDAFYGVAGLAYSQDGWTGSASYTARDTEGDDTDHLATTTIEYEILEGLAIGVGYKFAEEDGESSHTVGALAAYEFGL